MSQLDAIFRHGVFQPLFPVHLPEEQPVRLNVEPMTRETPEEWLANIVQLQAPVVRRQGILPDSAVEIAADRQR